MTTPLMEQYQEIKKQYQSEILFFRLGDFYEMFYDDAKIASRVMGIALTSRFKGEKVVPMAGIPYHAAHTYINRLLKAGHKIAICEQTEEADKANGLVDRNVVRVITPGTLTEEGMLDNRSYNFLAALTLNSDQAGLAWIDISTGTFIIEDLKPEEALDELQRLNPAECLLPDNLTDNENEGRRPKRPAPGPAPEKTTATTLGHTIKNNFRGMITPYPAWAFDRTNAYKFLTEHFKTKNLAGFGCDDLGPAVSSAGALLQYLYDTQKVSSRQAQTPSKIVGTTLKHITKIEKFSRAHRVFLDRTTQISLELTETIRGQDRAGSLLGVLDKTVTGMGARLLKEWITAPLIDIEPIQQRQDGISSFYEGLVQRQGIQQQSKDICDMERITAKLGANRANARDIVSLRLALQMIPVIKSFLVKNQADLIKNIFSNLDPLKDLQEFISQSLTEDPPIEITEGGLIQTGYHQELDKLRGISRDGKSWIARFQAAEIKRTGINSLKVGYNHVFGYYLEVTNLHKDKVPSDYIRKQTLKNAERYITSQLKDYETQVLNAEERSRKLEYELFLAIREKVNAAIPALQKIAQALAQLDVLTALAHVARENNYCQPEITDQAGLKITDGRHPVLEKVLEEKFVPNDVLMDGHDNRIMIITGPNMSGKSTYIRQVALIVLMAQMGSFIPAKEASIGVVDRIFTRVGASDELTRGASTFMVEMNETANILNNATPRSLIVLDEIGRGTSTFDGVSIAWAVTEYIYDRLASRTLFATHYHELTELSLLLPGVKNYHIAVKEWGEKIVFLRKIVAGGTDKSYGIHVARLAGIPKEVIDRAKVILTNLEAQTLDEKDKPRFAPIPSGFAPPRTDKITAPDPFQLSLFNQLPHPVARALKEMDVNDLTPLKALEKLQELKELLEEKKK